MWSTSLVRELHLFFACLAANRMTSPIKDQKIISIAKPVTSTRHGLYCGAMTSLLNQVAGYPYHVAPVSMAGVLFRMPVKSVTAAEAAIDIKIFFISRMDQSSLSMYFSVSVLPGMCGDPDTTMYRFMPFLFAISLTSSNMRSTVLYLPITIDLTP